MSRYSDSEIKVVGTLLCLAIGTFSSTQFWNINASASISTKYYDFHVWIDPHVSIFPYKEPLRT